MSYVLAHAWAAARLALWIYLAGLVLDRWLFSKASLGPLRPLARWLLGFVAWVLFAFALAAVGLLTPVAFEVAVFVVLGGGVVVLQRWFRDRRVAANLPSPSPARRTWVIDLVAGVLVAAVLLPVFLLAVGPTVSWDANVYHLTLPRLYLEAGGFRDVPVLVYGHWPQATEMLFTVAMGLSHYVTAKLAHFGFGLLTLWLLASAVWWAAARETGRRGMTTRAAGWLAVGLVLANDVVIYELRVAYVELAQAFVMLAAVLLLSSARDAAKERVDHRNHLILAGLACGLLAGIKITGILWLPVVAAVYLPALLDRRDDRARTDPARVSVPRFALCFGVPVLALWLPWLAKAWWFTGNPVYPIAWQHLGGPWWSETIGEQFAAWQQSIGMGRSLVDYALLPLRVVLAGGPGYDQFDGRLTPLWLIALPLSAIGAWRSPLARRALAVAAGCFVLWAFSSQQIRFLVPLLPLVALATGVGFAVVIERLFRAPRWHGSLRPLVAGSLAAATLLAALAAHGTVLGAGLRRWPLYQQQSAEALYARAAPPIYQQIEALAPHARLLMMGTNHGFFCQRPYLADSFFEASQLADWLRDTGDDVDAIEKRLAAEGITHVLLSTRPTPIPWPRSLARLLADGNRATPVYADAQFRLFALRET